MKIRVILIVLPLMGLCPLKAFCQGNTERGAVIGGLGGALAGAAIGKHNKETAAGALIGGAVGLIAGSAIGNAQDREDARQQALYQQQQAQYQYQMQQRLSRAVSPEDAVTLSQSGVDPQIIVTQIRQNGVTRRIEVADVIALHQQGVSEVVINAMQNATVATAVSVAPPSYSRPVVVQEHYHVAPPTYYRTYHYHHAPHWHHHHRHHHHGHHGSGFHADIVIGH